MRILVVAEGLQTERQYVEQLHSYLRSKNSTADVKSVGVGKDPIKVVEKCITLRDVAARKGKGYDLSICLVDVDRHSTLTDAVALAKSADVQLLISNLKFEVWLRWHVEQKRSAMTSKQLDELMKNLKLVQNKSISPHFPFRGVHAACETARQADPEMRSGVVGPNPSSSMPILIDFLVGN